MLALLFFVAVPISSLFVFVCSRLPGILYFFVTCMLTARVSVVVRPLFRSCSRINHACVVICERRKRAFFSLHNNATG